jgi:WD40 repeat protein
MWNVGNGQRTREFVIPVGRISNPSTVGRIANPSARVDGESGNTDGRIENPSYSLAVRNDNARLATGGVDGSVRIWNPGDGSLVAELTGPPQIAALAFSHDNQKLAVCGENRLFLYGPPTPPRSGIEWTLHQQVTAESPFTDIVFAPDNRRLFAAHATGHVSEWLYAAPTPLRQFNHGGPVYGVAISSDGRTIVSCSGDQTVRVWDTATGQQRAQLNGHQGAVYGLALTADAALALSSGADGTLRLWDVAGGRQLKQISSSGGTVYSIALDPQGGRFATAGGDRTIRLHDLLTGAEQRALTGHSDYIHSVAFHPRGDRLLSYGYAGHFMVWNAADGARLSAKQIGRVGNTAAYSPDGTRAVLATGNGEAHIITLPP